MLCYAIYYKTYWIGVRQSVSDMQTVQFLCGGLAGAEHGLLRRTTNVRGNVSQSHIFIGSVTGLRRRNNAEIIEISSAYFSANTTLSADATRRSGHVVLSRGD